jgi:hypothetical protein
VKAAVIVLELIVIAVGLVYVLGVYFVEWLRWRKEK